MITKTKKVSKKRVFSSDTVSDASELAKDVITAFSLYESLGEFVIGQDQARKTVALAVVNNRRRLKLESINKDLALSITPKNVLLRGPTGSGKTEIGRRVAQICDAPFLAVEMTKFTEVGYAGKDVENIIVELFQKTIKEERKKQIAFIEEKVKTETVSKVGKLIIKQYPDLYKNTDLEVLIKKIKQGEIDDLEIEIDIQQTEKVFEIIDSGEDTKIGGFNIIPLISSIDFGGSKKKKKFSIKEAIGILEKREIQKNLKEEDIILAAKQRVENNGIIFLDEFDKIITNRDAVGRGEVSREGVQRDLLSIVEGADVSTPFGFINTTHILFIASGAFHTSKPEDLMHELQGRFPIWATLEPLKVEDYYKILTKKKFNLIEQYTGLLSCSDIKVNFTDEAIHEIARSAERLNINLGNLGARRLFSIMELLTEEISFQKDIEKVYNIDGERIKKVFEKLSSNEVDLCKFVI